MQYTMGTMVYFMRCSSIYPNYDFQEKLQQFYLETKELTFLPAAKWKTKKESGSKKKTTNQPYLQKCIFIFKKEPTPPPSNAALELEHPPPVYASISTIRLLYNNSHIHK